MVVPTDSRNGCVVMYNGTEVNYLDHEIRETNYINSGTKFVIQWIPGHVTINGNELADECAEIGSKLTETQRVMIR